jgi:hypothetical protein
MPELPTWQVRWLRGARVVHGLSCQQLLRKGRELQVQRVLVVPGDICCAGPMHSNARHQLQ